MKKSEGLAQRRCLGVFLCIPLIISCHTHISIFVSLMSVSVAFVLKFAFVLCMSRCHLGHLNAGEFFEYVAGILLVCQRHTEATSAYIHVWDFACQILIYFQSGCRCLTGYMLHGCRATCCHNAYNALCTVLTSYVICTVFTSVQLVQGLDGCLRGRTGRAPRFSMLGCRGMPSLECTEHQWSQRRGFPDAVGRRFPPPLLSLVLTTMSLFFLQRTLLSAFELHYHVFSLACQDMFMIL